MVDFEQWQHRVDQVWQDRSLSSADRIVAIDALAADLGETHPVALFERAGARDSAGQEGEAEPLYRAAIAAGLDPARHVRAVIQLASTIRNLGHLQESAELLGATYAATEGQPLHDEAAAFYALALSSLGREREALAIALRALAPHLTFYTRSVTGYANELEPDGA